MRERVPLLAISVVSLVLVDDVGAGEVPADLSVTISVPSVVSPGSSVPVSWVCRNDGPGAAANVQCTLTVTLPSTLSSVSCVPAVPVSTLPSGGDVSCAAILNAAGTQGGGQEPVVVIEAEGQVQSTTFDPSPGNNLQRESISVLDAVDDAGTVCGTASFDVVANDRLEGEPVSPSTPGFSFAMDSPGACTVTSVSPTGVITVGSPVPPAGCTIDYRICLDRACDTARLVVSPCGVNLPEPRTIPALSDWGAMVLGGVLLASALVMTRRVGS